MKRLMGVHLIAVAMSGLLIGCATLAERRDRDELSRLESDLNEVEQASAAPGSLERPENRKQTRTQLERLGAKAAALSRQAAGLTERVTRLLRRIEWLESRMRYFEDLAACKECVAAREALLGEGERVVSACKEVQRKHAACEAASEKDRAGAALSLCIGVGLLMLLVDGGLTAAGCVLGGGGGYVVGGSECGSLPKCADTHAAALNGLLQQRGLASVPSCPAEPTPPPSWEEFEAGGSHVASR